MVKDSDGNKHPGLDDFYFSFVKDFWRLIKYEVYIMFDQFHIDEVIPRGFLDYFVTLILKVSSSLALKDYCPIYLLDTLYKLLSKVIARRLDVAMETIILHPNQHF